MSWLVGLLQLPMPQVDLSGYAKLNQLRVTDSAKYNQVIRESSRDSARQERNWNSISSCLIYAAIFASFWLWVPSDEVVSVDRLFRHALSGAAFVALAMLILFPKAKLKFFSGYRRRYPDGTDPELRAFVRAMRLTGSVRFICVAGFAVLHALFFAGRL